MEWENTATTSGKLDGATIVGDVCLPERKRPKEAVAT